MSSVLAQAAVRACRPALAKQPLALLIERRTLHASAPLHKKKQKKRELVIEDLFGDEEASGATPEPTIATTSSQNAPKPTTASTKVNLKNETSGGRWNPSEASFDEVYEFIKHRIETKPSSLEPEQLRNSAWLHLFNAAENKAHLRQCTEMFGKWIAMGRKFRDREIVAFVGRCHKLQCPNVAIEVFSNRPNYRLDIPDVHVARELLHSVQCTESEFEISMLVASLYTLYNLPPLAEDFTSCAMLLAQALRVDTPTSRALAEVLMPAFRRHIETSPPLVIPRDHIARRQGLLREKTWLRVACGTIDNILRSRGEDRQWLLDWRVASGHLPSRHQLDVKRIGHAESSARKQARKVEQRAMADAINPSRETTVDA